MSLFRASRERRGEDRFLPHKMIVFAVGAGFAIAGIVFERPMLVNAGIAVLAIGIVLRIMGSRRHGA